MLRTVFRTLVEYSMPIVFAASVLSIAVTAMPVVDREIALPFAMLATAWLLLARAFVAGLLGYGMKGIKPDILADVVPSLIVDAVAMILAVSIDPALVWATLVGIAFSEIFYAGIGRTRRAKLL